MKMGILLWCKSHRKQNYLLASLAQKKKAPKGFNSFWSRITNYNCSSSTPILVSILDPDSSVASDMIPSRSLDTEAKQFAS